MKYQAYLCGPGDCPADPAFEHDNYFGCIPRDFSQATGRSKSHRQHFIGPDRPVGRWLWNGGCGGVLRGLFGVAGILRVRDGRSVR